MDFDSLSNNELRDQLKAHGLGNFPVTDTTRNTLIKKLRNAVNGPAKPVKGRRETVNVVKHSSAEESESDADAKKSAKSKSVSNRRATIAASAPKPVNATNGEIASKPAPVRSKSPSRRSAAPEPISYFADASDDDLVAAAEEAEKQSKVRKTRTSRSPSLTKSSVVTTSYKHVIEPLMEQSDDVIFVDNSDAEYNSEMLEKVRKPSTPTTKISAATDNRRKTLQVGPSISTNFASTYSVDKTYEDSNAARRRYTTYASPAPAPAPARGNDDDDVLQRVETPYLSDFTRRLAQLKAEPLPGTDLGYTSPKSTTSDFMKEYKEYRSSIYSNAGGGDRYRSKAVAPAKSSAWSAVEKKVRWPLLIFVSVFVAVSLYVFFFSNY